MKTVHATAILLAVLLLPGRAAVVDDARALMERVHSRSSWRDSRGDLKMVLINKRGDRRVREIKLWSKKNRAGEQRLLMRFTSPADVRGTGFLLIEHNEGEDDRRMFLPALRRVQRISSSGKGGNFMSSDFTYYDIGSLKLNDWNFSFAGEGELGGVKCKLVAGEAASDKVKRETGYSKVVWYVDPGRLIVLGCDYYDKDGTKFKIMRVLKVEDIAGVPFATHMRMENLLTGHRSEIIFSNLEVNQGIPDRTFTSRNLRRWTR